MKIMVFELEDQRYGLRLPDVQEVLRSVAIARLPKAPSAVEGIINVRGRVVPVLNIRRRFGLPPKDLALSDHLILVIAGERTVALRADRVRWIAEAEDSAVERVTDLAPGSEYISGVAKLPDGLVLIHDPETFLSRLESEALDESLASLHGVGGEQG